MLRTHTGIHLEPTAAFRVTDEGRYATINVLDEPKGWVYATLFLERDDVVRLGDAIAAYLAAGDEDETDAS